MWLAYFLRTFHAVFLHLSEQYLSLPFFASAANGAPHTTQSRQRGS